MLVTEYQLIQLINYKKGILASRIIGRMIYVEHLFFWKDKCSYISKGKCNVQEKNIGSSLALTLHKWERQPSITLFEPRGHTQGPLLSPCLDEQPSMKRLESGWMDQIYKKCPFWSP
eukprot:TRINITY_DN8684_c0_g4_i1.p1 TRINITY_DN8684_c0_g4~~TRINITY_DN8684_c0_g4_i1.p1  ORF type:complete len:117 (-),score=14.17 TRINITY_DN8684_c0_g4_i1:535-885(-)